MCFQCYLHHAECCFVFLEWSIPCYNHHQVIKHWTCNDCEPFVVLVCGWVHDPNFFPENTTINRYVFLQDFANLYSNWQYLFPTLTVAPPSFCHLSYHLFYRPSYHLSYHLFSRPSCHLSYHLSFLPCCLPSCPHLSSPPFCPLF